MLLSDQQRLNFILSELKIGQQALADSLQLPVHKIKSIKIGKVKISPEIALLIEQKFNFDFKWLLTGVGDPYLTSTVDEDQKQEKHKTVNVDQKLLKRIIVVIEKELKQRKLVLDPDKKAEAISLLYEMYSESNKEIAEDTIERYLRLVA